MLVIHRLGYYVSPDPPPIGAGHGQHRELAYSVHCGTSGLQKSDWHKIRAR